MRLLFLHIFHFPFSYHLYTLFFFLHRPSFPRVCFPQPTIHRLLTFMTHMLNITPFLFLYFPPQLIPSPHLIL